MYGSYHEVVAANKADAPAVREYSVAGPICETGDILAEDRMLPDLAAGDLIAVLDAGAYGFAMSSQYNSRPRCAEVILAGEKAALMRRAETLDDLTASWKSRPGRRRGRRGSVKFHYLLVDDLVGREEFERRVLGKVAESGNLLDARTAAMLVVKDLGRAHIRF